MRYTQKDIRQKLGFTRDALRLYEKRGIIQPEIDPGNGYRYYDDWQMNLLWDCKYYQAMGFSLAEVQELLTARTPGDIESQLARREEEMRHDLRRRELALSEHSRFMEELRSSERPGRCGGARLCGLHLRRRARGASFACGYMHRRRRLRKPKRRAYEALLLVSRGRRTAVFLGVGHAARGV